MKKVAFRVGLTKKIKVCERFVQIAQIASILGIKEGDFSPLNDLKIVAHAINFRK